MSLKKEYVCKSSDRDYMSKNFEIMPSFREFQPTS